MDGPALPSPGAHVAHRPPRRAGTRLTGGPWLQWRRVNREVSLPLALDWLEKAGNLRNLELAAAAPGEGAAQGTGPGTGGSAGNGAGNAAGGEYRGPVYMDSDVHKVLESAAWELGEGHEERLAEFAARAAGLLERAQQEDGYLDSYYQVAEPGRRYTRLVDSHEHYCAGHLMQAAVAATRAGADPGGRLLAVARRLADHLAEVFLPGPGPGLDGHPEVETALVELYRTTGEPTYLELASAFVERRGHGLVGSHKRGARHRQDHLPVREAPTLTGHAVRGLYLEAGIVDVAVETGDEALLAASVARWEDMAATRTALTGGLGSRQVGEVFGERYELPPDLGYNETCASAASIQWSWRLLLATGEARYADLIERTLFNAFGAARSADGRTYYKGNPLQRRADHAEAVGDPRCRDEWFYSACCPPAVTRLVASLGHYAVTVSPDTGTGTGTGTGEAGGELLHLQQYAPFELSCALAGGEAGLRVETDYPWAGAVAVTVTRSPGGPWGLALRIPPWSERTGLAVNGEELPVRVDRRGYAVVRRDWRAGDTVTLRLDMRPRLTVPHPRIDAVRGCAAVERGPLVYCFEQVDQEDGTEVDRLALRPGAAFDEVPAELPGVGRTVLLRAGAVAVSGGHEAGLPYRRLGGPHAADAARPAAATAVPYFQWDNRGDGAMRVWMPLVSD
ncbi:glycoside hydrolase family 127 protein [Streptomyces hoynatensis]|uniref:Glycoside hydrolase family 127 protein n=1 Tax=Streptomyces hoynatensis TaxID=1141874 RepID=A0A3A9Z9M8_9ACTN|nr:beta-L-arabinofuranosidase domain-containing protein [Streptomyces hoynatensis]RKN44928.1 glycoside hydrolase family 127 protein [Streptomyces hoynatensis]